MQRFASEGGCLGVPQLAKHAQHVQCTQRRATPRGCTLAGGAPTPDVLGTCKKPLEHTLHNLIAAGKARGSGTRHDTQVCRITHGDIAQAEGRSTPKSAGAVAAGASHIGRAVGRLWGHRGVHGGAEGAEVGRGAQR